MRRRSWNGHRISSTLWQSSVSWSFYNEAFWLRERNRVRTLDLRWLDPDSMTPKWDKDAGLVGFERRIDAATIKPLKLDDVVYLWRQGMRETEPAIAPAQAAMQAAGVLYNADKFAADFFARGAIKATLLSIDGNPSDTEPSGWNRGGSAFLPACVMRGARRQYGQT